MSLSDFAIVTKREVTIDEVNEAFKKAAGESYYQGILTVTEEELVSSAFIGNSHSAIIDLKLTNVVGGNLLKVVAWYDNEWGYSNRLVELTADVGKLLADESLRKESNPSLGNKAPAVQPTKPKIEIKELSSQPETKTNSSKPKSAEEQKPYIITEPTQLKDAQNQPKPDVPKSPPDQASKPVISEPTLKPDGQTDSKTRHF